MSARFISRGGALVLSRDERVAVMVSRAAAVVTVLQLDPDAPLDALITGRTDDRWIRLTRRWTLVAWLFLSLGLLLGGRWAYDVLGWGGYWGWDPVEIAAFMPWLTGTAFLHSVMIQEKRGLLKRWNMLLIILTYDLVIFGTFLTRSGVLSSVHAFAESAIGPLFFTFIGLTLFTSIALLIHRWPDLRGETHLRAWMLRECDASLARAPGVRAGIELVEV